MIISRKQRFIFIKTAKTAGMSIELFAIPFENGLSVMTKANFRKDLRPCREIHTAEQRRLMKRIFAEEIQMHGSKF